AFGLDTTSWGGLPLPASLTSIGAPGCSAYLAPILFQILPNQGGTAVSSIALPFAPGFIGTSLYAQGLLGVTGFNPAGLVTTNAGRGRVVSPGRGRRVRRSSRASHCEPVIALATTATSAMSCAEQPRDRSRNGRARPCRIGPSAVKPPSRSVIL